MKAFLTRKLEIPMIVIIVAAIAIIALLVGLVLQNGTKAETENILVLPAAAGPPPLPDMDTWNIVYKDIRDGHLTTRVWVCVDPTDSRFDSWTYYQTYTGFFSACLNHLSGTR
jgi:hypothetical protein